MDSGIHGLGGEGIYTYIVSAHLRCQDEGQDDDGGEEGNEVLQAEGDEQTCRGGTGGGE